MMVGLLLPTINNPVYAEFVHALQRQLIASGYSLVVQAHEYDGAAEAEQARSLIGRGVDALVIVGTQHGSALHDALEAGSIPHLFVWSVDGNDQIASIGFCNRAAMRAITEYVIALGHRRLGVIAGNPCGNERAAARLAGVSAALTAAALPPAAITIQPFSIAGGRAGLAALVDAKDPPSAILCTTDLTAIGALAEARERGLSVPEQLSITGFDDIELVAACDPPLTTVAVPITEMAARVAEELVSQLSGSPANPSVELECRIVVRRSCQPPPRSLQVS